MSIENNNYYNDHRVRASGPKWYTHLDEKNMKAIIILYNDDGNEEKVQVPFKFEVCDTCNGKGSHVNPSIDAGGLSAEDFYEDPDFAEEYMNGSYDIQCYGCNGRRVVPMLNEENVNKDILKRIIKQQQEEDDFRQMQDAERRMGA